MLRSHMASDTMRNRTSSSVSLTPLLSPLIFNDVDGSEGSLWISLMSVCIYTMRFSSEVEELDKSMVYYSINFTFLHFFS
jgi:hypothetical protein